MRRFFQRRNFLSALGMGMVTAPFAARAGAAPAESALESGELRDRFELRELLDRYTHTVDFLNWDGLDSVFTDDATVDYSALADSFGDKPSYARGMREIRRMYEIVVTPNYGTLHYVSNPLIALYGDEARGCAYMHVGGGSSFGGVYLCGFVRTADGWRMRHFAWVSHTRAEQADAERVRGWMQTPPDGA